MTLPEDLHYLAGEMQDMQYFANHEVGYVVAAADRIEEQDRRIEHLEAGRKIEQTMLSNAAARIEQLEATVEWLEEQGGTYG